MTIHTEADALALKHGYWKEHPDYALADWQAMAANGDTRQGYWQWVASNLEDELANQQYEEDLKAERYAHQHRLDQDDMLQRGQQFVDEQQDRDFHDQEDEF